MGIKVGLIEIQQKTTLPPRRAICSREEGRLQVEQIQREEELNVSNSFRAGNIKNYLGQWISITSDKFIIETVKSGLKKLTKKTQLINTFPKWLTQQRKVKSFQKKLQNY